ncbi:MAG: signal peptidase I [Anaerovoracaceae bacterium]
MKIFKKVASVVLSVILWVVILLAALFAFTTLATKDSTNVASLAGFTPLTVESDSMAPTFHSGDLIIIKSVDPANLKEGDIITFHTIIMNEYALNTHRIAEIKEVNGIRSYVTKGDNNDLEDTHLIADGDIVGKYVLRLPYMGNVMHFLSSSTGFLVVIVLPMLIFFLYQIYHLIMVVINLKKAAAVEAAAEAAQKEDSDAAAKLAEAQAALEEAKRLKEEAEEKLRQANENLSE